MIWEYISLLSEEEEEKREKKFKITFMYNNITIFIVNKYFSWKNPKQLCRKTERGKCLFFAQRSHLCMNAMQ